MRALRYELPLSEFGYMIASGNIVTSDNEVDIATCLPMGLTVPEKSRRCFELSEANCYGYYGNHNSFNNEDSTELQKNYRNILLGKEINWLLYGCEVTARGLTFSCYNHKTRSRVSVIYEDVLYDVKFHLTIPHQDGRPDTSYDVHLHSPCEDADNPRIKSYQAEVFEYFLNGRRELLFEDESYNPPEATKFVYVNEYVDL